jgi:hypothetical protein
MDEPLLDNNQVQRVWEQEWHSWLLIYKIYQYVILIE